MKRLAFFVSAVMVLLVIFVAMKNNTRINNNDWAFIIHDEYQVWHINSETIVFGRMQSPNAMTHIVESYVSAFKYNSRYFVAERRPEGKHSEKTEYYIVRLEDGVIYGPIELDDLEKELRNGEMGELCDWVYTVPRPEGAVFR